MSWRLIQHFDLIIKGRCLCEDIHGLLLMDTQMYAINWKRENTMSKAGKIVALISAGLGLIAALITFFVGGIVEVLGKDASIANMGSIALLMSLVLVILAIVSFVKSSKLLPGLIMMLGAFTGIAGGTLMLFALLPGVIGSFLALLAKDPSSHSPGKFYESWWFWLILSSCGFALGFFLTLAGTEQSAKIDQNVKPEYSLSADELMSAYENNKLAAETKYNGKVVQISGVVYSISASGEKTAIAALHGNDEKNWLHSVNCNFSGDEQIEELGKLNKGMFVAIIGVVKGEDIMSDIVLENCRLVKLGVEDNPVTEPAQDPAMERQNQLISVVQQWNQAHNSVGMDVLKNLYASTVELYGKDMSNARAISIKNRQLTDTYRGFQQTVTDFSIQNLWDINPRVDFLKTVTVNGKTDSFDAYLILEEAAGHWSIRVESDLSTEKKLGRR